MQVPRRASCNYFKVQHSSVDEIMFLIKSFFLIFFNTIRNNEQRENRTRTSNVSVDPRFSLESAKIHHLLCFQTLNFSYTESNVQF
jgi:hypothetical protein